MYPHERSLVQKMEGKPFALIGVNSDQKGRAEAGHGEGTDYVALLLEWWQYLRADLDCLASQGLADTLHSRSQGDHPPPIRGFARGQSA